MNDTPELAYRFTDFLRKAGISRTKAYDEINAGRLRARKRGSSTIITAADAKAYLDSLPALEPKAAA
jgi:hypothetical protein